MSIRRFSGCSPPAGGYPSDSVDSTFPDPEMRPRHPDRNTVHPPKKERRPSFVIGVRIVPSRPVKNHLFVSELPTVDRRLPKRYTLSSRTLIVRLPYRPETACVCSRTGHAIEARDRFRTLDGREQRPGHRVSLRFTAVVGGFDGQFHCETADPPPNAPSMSSSIASATLFFILRYVLC